jgi:hypothetical protein
LLPIGKVQLLLPDHAAATLRSPSSIRQFSDSLPSFTARDNFVPSRSDGSLPSLRLSLRRPRDIFQLRRPDDSLPILPLSPFHLRNNFMSSRPNDSLPNLQLSLCRLHHTFLLYRSDDFLRKSMTANSGFCANPFPVAQMASSEKSPTATSDFCTLPSRSDDLSLRKTPTGCYFRRSCKIVSQLFRSLPQKVWANFQTFSQMTFSLSAKWKNFQPNDFQPFRLFSQAFSEMTCGQTERSLGPSVKACTAGLDWYGTHSVC